MEERGVNVDHATLNRWVIRYSPTIAVKATSQKRETNRSKIITSLSLRFPDFQRIVERADVVDVGESHGQESERKATLIRYFAEGLATVHYRCTLNVPPEQYYYCSPCITCPLTLTIRL
jgi:hypothetical protein